MPLNLDLAIAIPWDRSAARAAIAFDGAKNLITVAEIDVKGMGALPALQAPDAGVHDIKVKN